VPEDVVVGCHRTMTGSTALDTCGVAGPRIIGELPATSAGELSGIPLDHEGHAHDGAFGEFISFSLAITAPVWNSPDLPLSMV